ncbi:UDP-N-acetylmuramate--L-alanine ligase [Phormidium sp. CLA17]|uniref:UDP-N-acetylmuramate--L-alanine ligase n=1 Tax=Leptolyngbya sp. Cla-17 TaxID=2803751 RepID=UPI001490C47B|nr:UDP-N-acetylmuramate--L-alanine ligase [Leptolyngbya sp. Cla-17]MBM0741791.1 UDP-N-acetylmuramate--L-alanine ligase [Leptolyngbya sp. Cla-17]
MPVSIDLSGKPFHFIGVGGIGMSALAYVLAKRNLPVSGSDLRLSHITQRLQENGVHIFWSQDPSNLEFFQSRPAVEAIASVVAGTNSAAHTSASAKNGSSNRSQKLDALPQVICSTAIQSANLEYQAACDLGCSIYHRSDVLAALIREYRGIAIAGTHGKTTTSSLVGYMLLQAGLDPTIVVGGEVNAWQGNAHVGQGPYLVAEADESDGSLVKLASEIGVITNIELDHIDHYASLDEVIETFQTFKANCKTLIGSYDCPIVRDHLTPSITYSLDPQANATYTVDCISHRGGSTARVWERGVILGQLNVKLLGRHNLSNALAAVAIGRLLGLNFSTISQAIATFEGARRRFEHRGEYNGILFVDDYAHHPSELQATLAAARLKVQESGSTLKRIVAIFQPHRYSRTQAFLSEFAESFSNADVVIISDIYSAGESKPADLTGATLANLIAHHQDKVFYHSSLQSIHQFLVEILHPGDLALFMGAGNLNQIIPEVMVSHQKLEQEMSHHWRNHA